MKRFALIVLAAVMVLLGMAVHALIVFAVISVAIGVFYIAQDIVRMLKRRIEE